MASPSALRPRVLMVLSLSALLPNQLFLASSSHHTLHIYCYLCRVVDLVHKMESHDESRVNLLVSKVTRTTPSHSFPCILFPNLPSIVVIVGKFIYPEYSYSSLFLPCYSYTISSLPRSYSTLQFSAFWLPYTPSLVPLNCRHSTYLYFPFFINWQPSFLTCPYYHDPSCHPRRLSTSLSQHFHSTFSYGPTPVTSSTLSVSYFKSLAQPTLSLPSTFFLFVKFFATYPTSGSLIDRTLARYSHQQPLI